MRLKNKYVIICVRGENPILDDKINFFKDKSWEPLLKYTVFDMKTGKEFINSKRQIVCEFDEDECQLLDDLDIEPTEDTYYYVSQTELDLVNFQQDKKKKRKKAA